MARILNKKHFQRLSDLLDDPKVASTVVHGGCFDAKSL
jgi:aldehyde dehydrogenase (NAD+)